MPIELFKLFIFKSKNMGLINILLQTELATNAHQHQIILLILIDIGILLGVIFLSMRRLRKKNQEVKLIQDQHIAKIDLIRKDQTDTLEKIRVEMLKREEERTRQWMESEKETLHVLNGVSTLLDLSDKIGKIESEKILLKLFEIQAKVEGLTSFDDKLEVLSVIKEKIEVLAIIKEKVEKLDIIKEKVEKLDIIKEKVEKLALPE